MHFLIDLPHLIGLYSEREGGKKQAIKLFLSVGMTLLIQLTWPRTHMSAAAGHKITKTTSNSYDLSDLAVGQRVFKSFCINVSLTVGNAGNINMFMQSRCH